MTAGEQGTQEAHQRPEQIGEQEPDLPEVGIILPLAVSFTRHLASLLLSWGDFQSQL